MTDKNKLMAEALVEQRYADDWHYTSEGAWIVRGCERATGWVEVDPFSDWQEGYRQLFALVDWLITNHDVMWQSILIRDMDKTFHETLCNRVKWCFEQLAGESDD